MMRRCEWIVDDESTRIWSDGEPTRIWKRKASGAEGRNSLETRDLRCPARSLSVSSHHCGSWPCVEADSSITKPHPLLVEEHHLRWRNVGFTAVAALITMSTAFWWAL